MPLFRKRKIIYFLHLYKTGGTTINDLLFRNYMPDEVVNLYVPSMSTGQSGEIFRIHDELQMTDRLKVVYGHYAYGIHRKFPEVPYRYYCFVREPFDRLISTYYHLIRLEGEWQYRILNLLDPGFASQEEVQRNFPDPATYLAYDGLQNQQCMFITGMTPEVIARDQVYYAKMAIDHLEREFGFVGLQEDFEGSLKKLQKLLHLKTLNYTWQNQGTNRPETIEDQRRLEELIREKSLADHMIYSFVKKRYFS